MNDIALRAKSWQIFLLLFVPRLTTWYVRDEDLETALRLVAVFMLAMWLAFLVSALSRLKPDVSGYNYNWFLIDFVVILAAFSYSSITADPDFQISTSKFRADGLGAILMLYVVFAYLHIHWFAASLLTAKATGRRPDAGQTIGLFLGFFFWPIGIWLIQSKANKLWADKQWEQRAVAEMGNDSPNGYE